MFGRVKKACTHWSGKFHNSYKCRKAKKPLGIKKETPTTPTKTFSQHRVLIFPSSLIIVTQLTRIFREFSTILSNNHPSPPYYKDWKKNAFVSLLLLLIWILMLIYKITFLFLNSVLLIILASLSFIRKALDFKCSNCF